MLPASADPATASGVVARERVTVIAQTPTFYLALAGQPAFGPDTVGAVRRCMTYGGQVAPAAVQAWAAAAPGVRWGTYWGQSELSQLGTVGWFATLDDIPGGDPSWIGRPVSHLEVRVVDANGDDAEVGELISRSPSVMLGYHREPERTEAALGGGWLRTGDIVRIDAAGNLFFQDRRGDMIKSGGMNVSSQEVERVLHDQRRVRDVVTAGMRTGEFTVPDARLAALAMCDMLNGFSHWFQDGGELDLEDVVVGYVDLIVGRMLGSPDHY